MSTLGQSIKQQILVQFQALQTSGIINTVLEVDLGKDPLQIDPTNGYPMALVGMPSVMSDYEDLATNKRIYKFDVLVVQQLGQTTSDQDIEILLDNILNQFDNNFTLSGAALATVLPVEVVVAPISTADKTFACFFVTIKAQTLFTITNTNP